jgi:site-specific DNA recombinase
VTAVAIITRKSTRDDAKVSVTRQEAMGRDWAKVHHPDKPVLVFSDNAVSGTVMDRPGWSLFLDALKAKRIAHVWAYEQSRITRAGDLAWDQVCVLLSEAGIRAVHTQRQGTVSLVAGDRIHGRINSIFDQHEREVLLVRTLDGLSAAAREGRPPGATGYGYVRRYDTTGRSYFEIDETTAPVVRRIIASVLDGKSLGLITSELNRDGVPAPGSPSWRRSTVRRIAVAPRITGLRTHHRVIVGEAQWEPIIDRDTWERAQQSIGHPRRLAGPRNRFLLSGIAVCDNCGARIISHHISNKTGREPGYACPHRSRPDGGCGKFAMIARLLDPYVIDRVTDYLNDPVVVDALNQALAEQGDDAAPIRAELADVEAQMAGLAERWADGRILEFENAAARKRLLERRDEVLRRLAAVPSRPLVTLDRLLDAWRSGDTELRRPVIDALCEVRVRSAFSDGRRLQIEDRVRVTFRA